MFGRNGAGKSTIMKMITEVTFPTSGKITIDGRVSALLELTAGFDGEFTGRENIYLKCNIMGMNDDQIAKVEEQIVSRRLYRSASKNLFKRNESKIRFFN